MPNDYSSIAHSGEDTRDNGLVIEGRPWGLEKIFDYEAGGHHPLHLHDMLQDRYRVIHKLGSGGHANVWLCRDILASSPKYVAIKIIIAEASTVDCPEAHVAKVVEIGCGHEADGVYLSLPLNQFEINGPNGIHYAFVYPVLGPRVSRLPHLAKLDDPGSPLRKICFDATQAMVSLHARGICHGDFRPANILTRVWGLDGLSEEDVLNILGTPKTTEVVTDSGGSHELETAPRYLVYPVSWDEILADPAAEPKLRTGSACLTDFGESFEMENPPEEVGILQAYYSPEQALEERISIGCDLWALGCTLFEIRTGRKLFDTFDNDVDECLYTIVTILGKYPEPWWSETWERRKEFFEDGTDAAGQVVETCQEADLYNVNATQAQGDKEPHTVVFERAKPRSLQEVISLGLVYESSRGPQGLRRGISSEEAEVFADLLAQLLKYNPEERILASAVLEHEWFKLCS